MRRLKAAEWVPLRELDSERMALQYDFRRRLRNALIALMNEDRGWMAWIERNIRRRWPLCLQARMVEARARALVLKHYQFFGYQEIGFLLFREDWMFSDCGNLMAG